MSRVFVLSRGVYEDSIPVASSLAVAQAAASWMSDDRAAVTVDGAPTYWRPADPSLPLAYRAAIHEVEFLG